jgi:hypothetical protein
LEKTIKIADMPVTIVGVEEMRGPFLGQSIDNHVYYSDHDLR